VLGVLLVVAQVSAAVPADSTYAFAALRDMVEHAATANRIVPATLASYRAHIETEMALIIIDTLGRERTGQVEQMGGTASWNPDSGFLTVVEGYRSQSTGVPISMTSVIRNWSVPMLYGQRLLLGLDFNTAADDKPARVGQRRDTLRAVHPFAVDRSLYYRYSGGDTIGFITTATRRVPLVRIFAHPNLSLNANFAAFDGELDIDADRHEIVRMRGRFVVSERMSRYRGIMGTLVKATGAIAVAYVEFENAEHLGRYWLPAMQRVELQTTSSIANGMRFTFRTVSHFTDFQIAQAPAPEPRDVSVRRQTIFASPDSLERFRDWRAELGSASAAVTASDFDDMAPPQWRSDGPMRTTLWPSRFDRVLHYNRIEGVYTGVEGTVEMRDAAPGVVASARVGWAWSEKTVRGGASLSRSWSRSSAVLTAERALAPTQDFEPEFSGAGSGIGAFLASIEEMDWVDRSGVSLAHVRIVESPNHGLITLRLGAARDHDVAAALTHGPIVRSNHFLPNRHARNGEYGIASIGYEFHPNVTGELLEPGLGTTVRVESAAGDLSWTRTEGSLATRRYFGPFVFATRIDGGAVFGPEVPPQALFEMGGQTGRLSGFGYKEFAGDRMAIGNAFGSYALPFLRAPHHWGRWLIPGLSPGLGGGIGAGWSELSTAAARTAVLEMGDGTEANAVSHATGRVRASASIGLTFFSNSMQIGMGRPIDQRARWRWEFRLGQSF
jgi:hypothetical protein